MIGVRLKQKVKRLLWFLTMDRSGSTPAKFSEA